MAQTALQRKIRIKSPVLLSNRVTTIFPNQSNLCRIHFYLYIHQYNYTKGSVLYVGLLKKIDQKRTVKNVKNFFLDDYKRLCVLAGGGITAPKIDGMPKAIPAGNITEDKFIGASEYRKLLNTVATAVNACSVSNRTILLARYIEHKPNWKVAQSLGYEKSRYYELYDQACLEFADKLEYQTILLNDPDLVEDLHEYE